MTPRKLPSNGMSESAEEKNKKNKFTANKKRKDDAVKVDGEKKRNKSKKKKRKNEDKNKDFVNEFDQSGVEDEDVVDNMSDDSVKVAGEKKRNKSKKKIGRIEEKNDNFINKFGQPGAEDAEGVDNLNGKSKKVKKKRKKHHQSSKVDELTEKRREADQDEVFLISSGDEDCSKGMKKWVTEYHQSRPGLEVLQQRIDEFITAHEAQLEQEIKEKEAQAAEGGWTVVVHHKGRKKTTDSESGIAVGSVAQAVVEDKLAKKKKKEVGLDFYRFQRREAKRNEIMMLQSKFEQDRKRIQQLRAARKFKPY